jgi:GT2 family glycosyltransferase
MIPDASQPVAIVVIGRNEGERLKLCLCAAIRAVRTVVYVDSGSVDGSPAYARSVGCQVIELDPARPFSAARARNEGFAAVQQSAPHARFIQFIDGDCELVPGWLQQAIAALAEKPDAGIVCGHVREVHPEATVYNRLCDLGWQRNPGEIAACGGIFMVRAEVFRAVGGFRPEVIAAEDDEFCVRVRRQGFKIFLLDMPMVGHDAAMASFRQWWRRARRTGHAYAQVAALHGDSNERYFVGDRRRIWTWGLVLPGLALCLTPFTRGISMLVMLCLYSLQCVHIYRGVKRRGWRTNDAWLYAFFTVISRFPALQGMLAYHWRQRRGHQMTIIEHKGNS